MEHSAHMNPDLAQEFAALLTEHQRLVFKVATTYARSTADIEDLAQEIAVQLWRAFPDYDRERRFTTWMYRIALNVAISWLRRDAPRRQRSVRYEQDQHEPTDTATDPHEDDDGRRILRGFIEGQPALDRALLLLYLEEHTLTEISDILGLTTTNLTTKINRLKERLRLYAENEHAAR